MERVRIDRDEMLMSIAYVIAARGTCSRLQVGAVVSRGGRIIATGYNGAPAGLPHCEHDITSVSNDGGPNILGCKDSEHAERNAIAFAARYGLALEGSELHCTDSPCLDCARSIINAGIKRVSFARPYRITAGVELLAAAGVDTIDLSMVR